MPQTGQFYIYCYLDEALEPYYFGKGKGYRAWTKHTTVEVPPEDRIKIVMDGLDEETALRCEKTCIDFYGREKDGGTLKNVHPGGTIGFPTGEEHHLFGKSGFEHPVCGITGPMQGRTGSKHPSYGTTGALKGRTGAKHPTSKKYRLISPTGENFEIHGLSAFCREHGLNPTYMSAVAHGRMSDHKGWKCELLETKLRIATSPSGERFEVGNLSEFCKKHGLRPSGMTNVSNGRAKTHKGWRYENIT